MTPGKTSSPDSEEALLKQLGDNLRFYADARFKQLTLYLAWITLLAGGLLQFSDKKMATDIALQHGMPAFAMLVTAVFWVLETRTTLYWRAHRDAIPAAWPRPPESIWAWFNATNAVWLLYATIYAAWMYVAVQLASPAPIVALSGLLGLAVAAFSVSSYVRFAAQGSTKSNA
jgi:hypothetical protein